MEFTLANQPTFVRTFTSLAKDECILINLGALDLDVPQFEKLDCT